jgi:hypothetical protein
MVDFIARQARATGAPPSMNREREGGDEAGVAKPQSSLPPPIADGVDRMYRQLVENNAIATTQLPV